MKKDKSYILFALYIITLLLWPLVVGISEGSEGVVVHAVYCIIISAILYIAVMRCNLIAMLVSVLLVIILITASYVLLNISVLTTVTITLYAFTSLAGFIAIVCYEPLYRHFA